ncbi:Nif3-like dinuclear metal center hexameric protein [Secundilactobacillus folii]|uniref:GTP cyclohydrolase 1 type 2 homolog n=1 Tax=Secundilactobacillus folii TaxID=2678357 RepID=A0A7X2XTD1_9LACO|nr:Nif3-like dinuclear metal center hexameric protein [Secundilactobacillus folii]MTV81219.1 Nif3-like dinuclear metal center hexameric protein [Secundilactobacillus folii]
MKIRTLIERFERFAPQTIAEPKDPVGLQLGSLDADFHKVLVSLDVRPEVVDEAVAVGADFIFAHHPMMFHPARNLDLSDPQNQMYATLLQHHITVYAAHTNLDSANGGMNDWLASALGLSNTIGMVDGVRETTYLLTTHIQSVYADAVRLAMVGAGAGNIDHFSGASFEWSGTTWFTPLQGADPKLGAVGERNHQEELSLQTQVPASKLQAVIQAITEVYPGGQPAIELTQLANSGQQFAMGRIGDLPNTMTVREFAEHCKQVFHVKGLRVVADDMNKPVQRIAVLGGDGGKFFKIAQRKGADAYVTGDVYYHTGHDMIAAHFPVIDPGHHIESICKPQLTALFQQWQKQNDWQFEIQPSTLNTDPFTFI